MSFYGSCFGFEERQQALKASVAFLVSSVDAFAFRLSSMYCNMVMWFDARITAPAATCLIPMLLLGTLLIYTLSNQCLSFPFSYSTSFAEPMSLTATSFTSWGPSHAAGVDCTGTASFTSLYFCIPSPSNSFLTYALSETPNPKVFDDDRASRCAVTVEC